MRRLGLILAGFAILAMTLVPTFAQSGGTIADIIQSRSDAETEFTILQQFLDASPGVRNRLDRAGSYTLFAPSDRAFRNLAGAIDLSLNELLSDEQVVRAILNYHVVDSVLTAQRLRLSNGQVLETELSGAFIGVRVAQDRTIVVNNVVEVVEENIAASNGYIHEINDVLLNRVINELLDDKLRSTPIPTATPSPTSTPMNTPTPIPQTVSTANVRVAHFASDVPEIDLVINDDVRFEAVEFGIVTEFENVSQGIYTAQISSPDDDLGLALNMDLTLLNGDFVTIVLAGSIDEDSVEAVALTDDFDDLDEDEARVVVYHAIEDAPALSLLSDGFEVEGITFAEFEQIDIDPVALSFTVFETRNDDSVLIDDTEQSFEVSAFYFVALYGTADSPELIVIEDTAANILRLQTGQTEPVVEVEDDNEEDVRDGSIVDVLDAEDGFSILVEAIQSADEDIINLLGNTDADTVTFLAPTDQAFINLLSTIGYSRTRLLSNTDLLSDILWYHIIDGALLEEDFAEESGTSIVTLLEPSQAFFVRAGSDGRIFLNGSVEFENTNIQASNGVIHIVDDVLLPQSVLDALGL